MHIDVYTHICFSFFKIYIFIYSIYLYVYMHIFIYVYVYTYIYTYIKDPTDFWSALFYLFLDLYEGQRQYFCSL